MQIGQLHKIIVSCTRVHTCAMGKIGYLLINTREYEQLLE